MPVGICLDPAGICFFVDASDGPRDCDPLEQAFCTATEKCTWSLQDGPVCRALSGSEVGVGASCTTDPVAVDNCVKGAICDEGRCHTICNLRGQPTESGCSPDDRCIDAVPLFLEEDGVTLAGICVPQPF